MAVMVHDPYVQANVIEAAGEYRSIPRLEAALPETDVLTVHLPLGPESRGLIGSEELAALPPHAFVINAARGGIVDEPALYDALSSGSIAGAGLGRLRPGATPLGPPSFTLPNVVLSPTTPASARKPRSAWRSPPPATPSPPSTASSTPRWWSTARSCKGAQIQPSARSTGSPPRVCSGSAGSKMAWHVHAPVQDAHDVDAGGDLAVEDHVSAARVLSIALPYGAGGPPEPRIMREQLERSLDLAQISLGLALPHRLRVWSQISPRSACARGERT